MGHRYIQVEAAGFRIYRRTGVLLDANGALRVDVPLAVGDRTDTLVPDSPPLVAIEVLSPDDRLSAVREKLQEYRAWGVPHVWLVDPHSRRLYNCDTGLTEVTSFAVPELGVNLGPAEIFD